MYNCVSRLYYVDPRILSDRTAAMIEPHRTMCPHLRKRNIRNIDKEKHATCMSADVPSTFKCMETMLWILASYVFFLVVKLV